MTVNSIPNAGQPIAGGMRVDPTWYKWLRELDREARDTGADLSAEIQAIARKLGSPDGTIDGIPESSQSLTALPPLSISGNQITLSTLTADTAGELFGITRDAYGRISALRPVVAGAGITIDGTTDPDEIAIVNSGLANPMTTAGDLIRGGVAGAPERIPVGSNTQVLTVVSGVPAWAAAPGGLTNPMTTAGDLITGGASGVPQRLAIGSAGQVLKVVSGAPAWAADASGGSALEGLSKIVGYAIPAHNATHSSVGFGAIITTGSGTFPVPSTATALQSRRRLLATGTSGTASTASFYVNSANYVCQSVGYKVVIAGSPSAGLVSTSRFFMGLRLDTGAFSTGANPSALLNIIALACDSGDTNLQMMHNDGSGTATKIDLGASFPKPSTDNTDYYRLTLECAPGGSISYTVERFGGASATTSGTLSTDLPASTTYLAMGMNHQSGGTTATAAVSSFGFYFETAL